MQATRMNADLSKKEKIRVYQRLKIRVIRVLFFLGTRMKRMQATQINADFKAKKKKSVFISV